MTISFAAPNWWHRGIGFEVILRCYCGGLAVDDGDIGVGGVAGDDGGIGVGGVAGDDGGIGVGGVAGDDGGIGVGGVAGDDGGIGGGGLAVDDGDIGVGGVAGDDGGIGGGSRYFPLTQLAPVRFGFLWLSVIWRKPIKAGELCHCRNNVKAILGLFIFSVKRSRGWVG